MDNITVRALRQRLPELDQLTGQTTRRVDEIVGRFETFLARAYGIEVIEAVRAEHAEAFVKAKGRSGDPSTATMHLRRSALRLFFRFARDLGVISDDPTLDLDLPPRSLLHTRPLDDDEIALGRSFSLHSLKATRHSAAWALAEATARTSELPHITTDNLDLDNSRVWLHGGSKGVARWGLLDEWGVQQLDRRARALRGDKRLVYRGGGGEESQQASCCNAINDTLIRAGLGSEPDVRPASVPAWKGRLIYGETNSVEEVARRCGIRSLDTAAQFIALDWQN